MKPAPAPVAPGTRPGAADVRQLAAHVAAFGLPEGPSGTILGDPLGDAEWQSLLRTMEVARVHPLLVQAVAAGSFAVTDEQRDEVSRLDERSMCACLMEERALMRAAAGLDAAGITFRVFKGPALAHLYYPDPALRTFSDIDLLVPSDQFDDAVAALTRAGFTRNRPEIRPGFDRRYAKAVTLSGSDRTSIDLHRTLVPGYFGLLVRLEDLYRDPVPLSLGGSVVHAVPPDVLFLSACFTIATDGAGRLRALRDIAQLRSHVDADNIIDLAKSWGSAAILAHAVTAAWTRLPIPEDTLSRWAAGYEPTSEEERALRVLTPGGGGGGAEARAALAALPTAWSKARYLVSLALPRRRLVKRIKRRGYLDYWRRGIRGMARPR